MAAASQTDTAGGAAATIVPVALALRDRRLHRADERQRHRARSRRSTAAVVTGIDTIFVSGSPGLNADRAGSRGVVGGLCRRPVRARVRDADRVTARIRERDREVECRARPLRHRCVPDRYRRDPRSCSSRSARRCCRETSAEFACNTNEPDVDVLSVVPFGKSPVHDGVPARVGARVVELQHGARRVRRAVDRARDGDDRRRRVDDARVRQRHVRPAVERVARGTVLRRRERARRSSS